mmetsp:Transcript_91873/g.176870  ORF Transcript_91873/g.176870 Transcript_91873/m.176870 type:complete len:338 (-) Transcript_91873:24-1037(-)
MGALFSSAPCGGGAAFRPRANVMIRDPRPPANRNVEVLGFYYPGKEEACDVLCGVGFLGNFWNVDKPLRITAAAPGMPAREHCFLNAEAAFQALKFWNHAADFESITGHEAFALKKSLAGTEDFTYGGKGSNWKAMQAVLEEKFAPNSALASELVGTGDAYLLEHNSVTGRDKVWSDNCDGEGTNWLGLQLMLVRDRFNREKRWTRWLQDLIDMETGQSRNLERGEWQNSVRAARNVLVKKLEDLHQPALCARPGCGKPTWNGLPGEYCSKSCRPAQGGKGGYTGGAYNAGRGGGYPGGGAYNSGRSGPGQGGGGGYPGGAYNAGRGGSGRGRANQW